MKSIAFDGIEISSLSVNELITSIRSSIRKNCKRPVVFDYINAHSFMMAKKNKLLFTSLKNANIIYSDGWAIVIACKIFGKQISNRLTAYDFFPQFLDMIQKNNYSIFLLGNTKNRIEKTAQYIKNKYPTIKIAGFCPGYFNRMNNNYVIHYINACKPSIVLIGMGTPKQEIWTYTHKNKLNVKVLFCVGGLFNYLSGDISPCPPWLGNIGFQWLWRLIHEPKRLWKRYLVEFPQFIRYIIWKKFLN